MTIRTRDLKSSIAHLEQTSPQGQLLQELKQQLSDHLELHPTIPLLPRCLTPLLSALRDKEELEDQDGLENLPSKLNSDVENQF